MISDKKRKTLGSLTGSVMARTSHGFISPKNILKWKTFKFAERKLKVLHLKFPLNPFI